MKKSFLISIILMALSPFLFSQALGDVNNSGSIDIVDALLTAQYYVGITPAVFDTATADVNCSGTIDIVDALLMAQYYVGLIAGFPCGTTKPTAAPTTAPTAGPTIPPTIEPTVAPTAGPETPDPTEEPWSVKLQYRCGETASSAAQIKPVVNLVNTGSSSVPLGGLAMRYFYSKEGSGSEEFGIDYAVIGSSYVTGAFGSGYLEIGFTANAPSLSGGESTGEIQIRINKSDWSVYDQSNDYSFDPAIASFTDFPKIALYQNGVFIWGIEPGGVTPGPTEIPTPTAVPTATPAPQVYYSDFTSGNDSNDGKTQSAPWKNCPGMAAFSGSAQLYAGDTVYFNNTRTWTATAGDAFLEIRGGVLYDGSTWGTGTRATFRTLASLPKTMVNIMEDHPDIPTIVRGFDLDSNNFVMSGAGMNWPWVQRDLLGATKRIENCIIHNVASNQSLSEYEYGIIISGHIDHHIANVEVIDCKVFDISRDGIVDYLGNDVPENWSDNVLIRGCEVYNTGQDPNYQAGSGIAVKNRAYNTIVEYNYVHDAKGSGISISSDPTMGFKGPQNLKVRYNILVNNNTAGIFLMYDIGSIEVYGNFTHKNLNGGFYMTSGVRGEFSAKLYNNTFYQSRKSIPTSWAPEVNIEANQASINCVFFEVRNNIFASEANTPCFIDDSAIVSLHTNNIYYSPSGELLVRVAGTPNYSPATVTVYEPAASSADPLFKNTAASPAGFAGTFGIDMQPSTDGFSLAIGSPGLDGGTALGNEYGGSINTITRPQGAGWDRGAYEQ